MKINGGRGFSVATLLVFLLSAAGYFFAAPSSILDLHGRDACNASSAPGASGRVYLQVTGGAGGNFSMKGTVFVPIWLWPKDTATSQNIWLDLPQMGRDGEVHSPWVPTLVSPPFKTEFESTAVYQMEVAEQPVGVGSLRAYPLDSYWVGIQSVRLALPTQVGEPVVNVPLELHVRFDGEPGWDARRKIGANTGFHDGFDTAIRPVDQSQGAQACGLVISRSPWYLGLVGSLFAVMLVPAIYVWRRPRVPAGLELIAAILGVATIRTYLIGTPSGVGSLLPFDFVLALIVGAVAFIPLWRPHAGDED
jgi:hypothetical protein